MIPLLKCTFNWHGCFFCERMWKKSNLFRARATLRSHSSVLRSCLLHMSGISKASMPGLRSSLVVTHLQIKLTFGSPELILCECPLILFSHFGSKPWSSIFWMFLSLKSLCYDLSYLFWCHIALNHDNNTRILSRFNWFRIRFRGRLLWTRLRNFRYY